MRLLFYSLTLGICLISITINAQPAKPGYVCVFNEEFNEELNTDYWKIAHGKERGLGDEEGYYRPENINVFAGFLDIYSKKETFQDLIVPWINDPNARFNSEMELDPEGEFINLSTWNYSTGQISTFQPFKFGYFEAECQVPEGAGKNSAFWLFGPGPKDGCDEIDFFEIFGNSDSVHVDIHCNSGCKDNFWVWENYIPVLHHEGNWYDMSIDPHGSMHTYAAEWDPSGVTYYVDGRRIDRYEKDYGFNQRLILNVGLGSGWVGDLDDNYFPSVMSVNYVRVYNKFTNSSFVLHDFNDSTYSTAMAYKDITISDGNDNVTIPGIPIGDISWKRERGFLGCYATDFIKLKPGFHAELGSDFKAKIVSNPGVSLKSAEESNSEIEFKSEIKESTTGISEEFDFVLYPNPSKGELNIRWTGSELDQEITIICFNSAGNMVLKTSIFNYNAILDLSNLPAGMYSVRCISSENVLQQQLIIL